MPIDPKTKYKSKSRDQIELKESTIFKASTEAREAHGRDEEFTLQAYEEET
ncbi:hypothetical protein KI387_005299, partial [Taxus chinensis]